MQNSPCIFVAALCLLAASSALAERTVLQARASELDPAAREHPEIDFTFGTAEKPADLEKASVDLSIQSRGQLVIWLMGYNDELFVRLNDYGLHAIQVHYANKWFGKLCRPTPKDGQARGDVRLEAATGQDHSPELNLTPPDGMMERARHFLIWLAEKHPEGNWQQFLTEDHSAVRWDKVIISGSSHGSTTAARFAKQVQVARVVMLCGPRDQDQDWQALPSATPAERFFGFSHVLDGGWAGDHYCRSWELLNLNQFGPIAEVEKAQPPYDNTRRLISTADVGGSDKQAHSAVTPGKNTPKDPAGRYLYEPVWRYLYTHPVDQVGLPVPRDPDCNHN
ncbi:MAG: hypothetical protein KDK99_15065 [Verrucomicrobiales bacterium]|nr:hypothetical protein [Verrucomicrobiales bacterium]